jgi:hypothetical protein
LDGTVHKTNYGLFRQHPVCCAEFVPFYLVIFTSDFVRFCLDPRIVSCQGLNLEFGMQKLNRIRGVVVKTVVVGLIDRNRLHPRFLFS